jgi:hypothetical protein
VAEGRDAVADLLEYVNNTVTGSRSGLAYEVAKHKCRCWFCPECAELMGYTLRKRLLPILATFRGLLLVTFTVDPTLFPSPRAAYLYMRQRRCIARTIQDLHRWGFLVSPRYFYVVEWQRKTEQAHFHVLVESSYIPWAKLLQSWDKHRPPWVGPVVGDRPAFGTVLISMPRFAGGFAHAARYTTKYLTKMPLGGFPSWVLELGAQTRVRRYSASRGFWGTESERGQEGNREMQYVPYRQRVAKCGTSVDVFAVKVAVDKGTGELVTRRVWRGELDIDTRIVFAGLLDPGKPRSSRRSIRAGSLGECRQIISYIVGREVHWRHGGTRTRLRKELKKSLVRVGLGVSLDDWMKKRAKQLALWN